MRHRNKNKDILGFLMMVFLILLGFKLSGSVIAENWSWWIVTTPLSIYLLYNFSALKSAFDSQNNLTENNS